VDKRILSLIALMGAAFGCARDPGVNAPPDPPVSQAKIDQMTPQQRAAYDQAMKSRDEAMAATKGKGPLVNRGNGQ
jgi:hypothetical protein